MEHENPILSKTFEVAGRTHHLTSFAPPPLRSVKPNVPPAIKRLVGELGLRYRPAAQADLEAHAASLALLASDLHDVPPHLLEKAIAQHVLSSPYLPKASDLITIARSFVNREAGAHGPVNETMAQRGNRLMPDEIAKRGLRWFDDDSGGAFLGHAA